MQMKIADNELTLTYNMSAWYTIEATAEKKWFEVVQDLDTPNRVQALMVLLFGLSQDEQLTVEWLNEHMQPTEAEFVRVANACTAAISEGMKTEKGSDEPTDVGLAELEKKEGPDT